MDKGTIRNKIKQKLFEVEAFVPPDNPGYENKEGKRLDPSDIQINDETVGVIEYKYDAKEMQDVHGTIDNMDPFFVDIEIYYVGVSEQFDTVSINVKHKYKNLLNALMSHFGFEKDLETWGDEVRGSHKTYMTRQNISSGAGGGYPMPFLLGEGPGGFSGWGYGQ